MGTSATKAKRTYNSKNYDRIYPWLPKGRKAIYDVVLNKVNQKKLDLGNPHYESPKSEVYLNELCIAGLDRMAVEILGKEEFERLMAKVEELGPEEIDRRTKNKEPVFE